MIWVIAFVPLGAAALGTCFGYWLAHKVDDLRTRAPVTGVPPSMRIVRESTPSVRLVRDHETP